MPNAVIAAVEELRAWVLQNPWELALVFPVVAGVPGDPTVVATGDSASVQVDPARVLRAVLRARADGFVLVHTHLADVPPGPSDLAVTRRLVAAAATIGVPLLGHFVLAPSHTYDCFEAAASRRGAA